MTLTSVVCGVLFHDVLDGEGLGTQHALR